MGEGGWRVEYIIFGSLVLHFCIYILCLYTWTLMSNRNLWWWTYRCCRFFNNLTYFYMYMRDIWIRRFPFYIILHCLYTLYIHFYIKLKIHCTWLDSNPRHQGQWRANAISLGFSRHTYKIIFFKYNLSFLYILFKLHVYNSYDKVSWINL